MGDTNIGHTTYCEHPEHAPLDWDQMPGVQHAAILIAAFCTIVACVFSGHLIYSHVVTFTNLTEQTHICRILLMVPIYAVASWCSLWFNTLSVYFDVGRDCYEAFVIWEFCALLMSYLGGTAETARIMSTKPPTKHPFPFCYLPPFVPGTRFLILCKRFILQYVFVQVACALLTFVMELSGIYCDGEFTLKAGYTYITTIIFWSVSFSMYFLVLFYIVLEEELRPHRPMPKFLAVKAVIFFSFWQSVLLSMLSYFGVIHEIGDWSTTDIGAAIDNFIICVEMMIISVFHVYIFSHRPYLPSDEESLLSSSGGERAGKNFLKSVANPSDVWSEASQAFGQAGKRERGRKLLKEFLASDERERKNFVLLHGKYSKLAGMVTMTWNDYYFFLLKKPKGICWFDKDPFSSSSSIPSLSSLFSSSSNPDPRGDVQINLVEEEREEREEEREREEEEKEEEERGEVEGEEEREEEKDRDC